MIQKEIYVIPKDSDGKMKLYGEKMTIIKNMNVNSFSYLLFFSSFFLQI